MQDKNKIQPDTESRDYNMTLYTSENVIEDFTIVLSGRRKNHYGQIINTEGIKYAAKLNAANELYFIVHKEADGKTERLWNEILDLRLVWVKEINEYFEIQITINESDANTKIITGKSLCECELSQINLYNMEINTEEDIERDDYVITKFYDANNTKASLLHRLLEKAPTYSIKHVDASLTGLQRSFSVDNISIYDFLTGDCSEQFHCLFQFDSRDRTISVYDLYTVCIDCRYSGEFNDICPECGSRNLKYFGEDTTILVGIENLTEEIKYQTDVDSIKNCFKLEGGDDTMTAAIRSCIPNGSDEIYYISSDQKKDMSDELVNKFDSYDTLYNSYIDQYQDIMSNIYNCINQIVYYKSKMMPSIDLPEITATTEAEKLTQENLGTVSITQVTSYTSVATVNSAMINYAKVFVKTGYVRLEVNNSTFKYIGKDSNGTDYGTWTGQFKITNYSDKEDVAFSRILNVTVTNDYLNFIEQKIKKGIASNNSDNESIYDVLSIKDLDDFKNGLTYYCLNRLISFHDAVQSVIDILIEEGAGNTKSDLYDAFYLPYYNKLNACQEEIDKRKATIDNYEKQRNIYISQKESIQEILNFKKYLGEKLYHEFCNYKREEKYSNSNYISDGLSDDELFQKARDFIDEAQKEIVKSGEYQHSITADLNNLLALEEFRPIVSKFALGNWIRIRVEDEIYRLRLVSYEIDFDSLETINTKFSTVTKTVDGLNDFQSIIKNTNTMATSYSYFEKKAGAGQNASDTFEKIQEEGLNSALYAIKNADSEELTISKHGLLARSYDDISDSYLDEQLIITHNMFAYTNDKFKSVKSALGKQTYTLGGVKYTGYGLNADFCIASTIIGANINNGNGTFTVDPDGNVNSSSIKITGGSFNINNRFIVDEDGNVTLPDNATISWNNITGTDSVASKNDIPTDDYITNISKKAITTSFIKTLNLTVGNEIAMGNNATISWNNVTHKNDVALKSNIPTNVSQLENDSGYQDNLQVTEITKNTVTTNYVNALNVKAGSVDAEDITGIRILGKEITGGVINSANIYFCFDPLSDDPLNAFCGGIINRTSGRYGELVIYGNNKITLSTLESVDDGGYINFERRADFEDGITIGKTKTNGGGWSDYYLDGTLSGSIFMNYDGFCIESRNNKDLALNADSGSGVIRYYGQIVQNSSKRYKEKIQDISEEIANKVLELSPKEYYYKSTGKHGYGFIAESVYNILPQIVLCDSEGRPDGVSYVELTPIYAKKIQMQELVINNLQKELNNLKSIIKELKNNGKTNYHDNGRA